MLSDSAEPSSGYIESSASAPPPVMIASACRVLRLSVYELRIAYWAFGGMSTGTDLLAYLKGGASLPVREYDVLAAVVNDRLIAADLDPIIPYSEDLT